MELELYKPYTTRDGRKAVVVSYKHMTGMPLFIVWHEHLGMAIQHETDGTAIHVICNHDIVDTWSDKKFGKIWVHVMQDQYGNIHYSFNLNRYEFTIEASWKSLAIVGPVDWAEGQGL